MWLRTIAVASILTSHVCVLIPRRQAEEGAERARKQAEDAAAAAKRAAEAKAAREALTAELEGLRREHAMLHR